MYQILCECGYEIQVIGTGENGLCRVADQNNRIVFHGTYGECVKWLADRAVRLI